VVLQVTLVQLLLRQGGDRLLHLPHDRCRGLLRFRQVQVRGSAHLVRETQGLGPEDAVIREDRHEVLLAAHDERRDAGAAYLLHGRRQQPVRLGGVAAWSQVIGPLEVHGIDVGRGHEPAQVDIARLVRRQLLQLVIRDGDVLVLLDLVTAHDLVTVQRPLLLRAEIAAGERRAIRRDHAQ
jgi:hypothetical protein